MFELLRYKYVFLGISGLLVVASVVLVTFFGLTPGTDLVGGTRWQMRFENQSVAVSEIVETLKSVGVEAIATQNQEGIITVRLGAIDEPAHAA